MDHRGQGLQVFAARRAYAMSRKNLTDRVVEVGGSQLHRMSGYHPRVEAVEPARMPVVPRSVRDDGVISNAIVPCFGEGPVRDLVHADGARCRAINGERMQAPGPAPVGADDGIARPLDLGDGREKVRWDCIGGVLAKQRCILPPRFRRCLVQRTAHREEEFGGFADHLVDAVDRERRRRRDEHAHEHLGYRR